jgi:small-conductance mechanosensitive channel
MTQYLVGLEGKLMAILEALLQRLQDLIPTTVTFVAVVLVLAAARWFFSRRYARFPGQRFRLQLIMLVLSFLGLLVVILALPISEGTIGQLLSLLGLLLSAAIALSATTFVGNIMAGLMLRAVRNFRPGDFIRVGDYFGRVSEMELFHVEIQTEDRDLATMPNLYLVTHPVKVIRSSGTLVTAEVSLGYDISRQAVFKALRQAGEDANLNEPFVHVIDLNDFSVTYRLAGLLTDVKSLLSSRSRVRECMLDRLHEQGFEIVSPTFMNQRQFAPEASFIPEPMSDLQREDAVEHTPEAVVFDKADQAESLERLQERLDELITESDSVKAVLDRESDPEQKKGLHLKLEGLQLRVERLSEYITRRKEDEDK